jgi:thioredoxin-related protein
MKIVNLFLFVMLFIFSGCRMGPTMYEVFERKMNFNVGKSFIPHMNKQYREIYSNDKYIYIFEDGQCVYGFLTNRDGKPEKVVDWIILSGKKYCKEQQQWILSF